MMANSPLYIAGVGVSRVDAAISNALAHELGVSAAVKALLDAGVTYDDIDHSVVCFLDDHVKIPKSGLESFGKTGSSVSEVDCYSGLFAASQAIKSGYADCVLMIGLDEVIPASSRVSLASALTGYIGHFSEASS